MIILNWTAERINIPVGYGPPVFSLVKQAMPKNFLILRIALGDY